jgi:lipoprotein-releasing system permease protein
MQGALFGLAGSLLGGMAGYGMVAAFNSFGPKLFFIPINPWLLVAAAALATVAGVISAAVPARRAARLDPVEAIRHV